MRLRLRDEELVAQNVEVEAGRGLLDPLGYGEGRDSDRDTCVGFLAEAGARQVAVVASGKGYATWWGQVIRVSLPVWRRRIGCHLFDAMRGRRAVGVMPRTFCVSSGHTGEVSNRRKSERVALYGNEGRRRLPRDFCRLFLVATVAGSSVPPFRLQWTDREL